jgi:hypothetical protein
MDRPPLSNIRLCSRCVTSDRYPGIVLDRSGVCSHCREYETIHRNWKATRLAKQDRFERLVAWAKKQHRPYDALVPLSGGKDSTYVLYLAAMKYNLKVLCFTFDNGFQSDVARWNIAEAVRKSGADHIVIRPDPSLSRELYKHFLRHTGLFCPVCMRGICAGTFALIRRFHPPLVLKGTSVRTEEKVRPEFFQDGRYSFFRNVLKAHPFPRDVGIFDYDRPLLHKVKCGAFLLSHGGIRLGLAEVQVPDFLGWDYAAIYRTIATEMGWRGLPDRDEHVDCEAEPVANYLRRFRVPELTRNMLRYSAEIRAGQRDRRSALQEVENERLQDGDAPAQLESFLMYLGLTREEFSSATADPFRHMRFQGRELLRRWIPRWPRP